MTGHHRAFYEERRCSSLHHQGNGLVPLQVLHLSLRGLRPLHEVPLNILGLRNRKQGSSWPNRAAIVNLVCAPRTSHPTGCATSMADTRSSASAAGRVSVLSATRCDIQDVYDVSLILTKLGGRALRESRFESAMPLRKRCSTSFVLRQTSKQVSGGKSGRSV